MEVWSRPLGALALLAGSACQMSADYGGTNYLCPTGDCPDGLVCVAGHCTSEVATADGGDMRDGGGGLDGGDPANLVVFEAEDFTANVMQGQVPWNASSMPGSSGDGAMLADGPGISAITWPDYYTQSSRLDYDVTLPASGIYYVWIRGMAWSGSDTCIPGIDGTGWAGNANPAGSLWVPVVSPVDWTWGGADGLASEPITVAGEAGPHTVGIWLREDGIILDKILLTTDGDYVPTALGPPANH
jgi:hypothetical protein